MEVYPTSFPGKSKAHFTYQPHGPLRQVSGLGTPHLPYPETMFSKLATFNYIHWIN